MVALRKLYPGDLILEEAPLVFVPDNMDKENTARMLDDVVGRMTQTQRDVLLCLSDCRNPLQPDHLGRFYTNAHSWGEDAVLCPIMARANHSCRPNAEFVTRKDLGVQHLRAIYVVEEGEEVEINYMLMSEEGCQRREGRQEYLRKCYGFQCICKGCTLQEEELAADESLREALQELQARGVECLSHREVEVFLAGLYRIQAKLSYILEVVEQVFLSSSQPVKMVEYCLHGLNLATQLYGEQAEQAKVWEERAKVPAANQIINWAEDCIFK